MINKYSAMTFMAIITSTIPSLAEEKASPANPPTDQAAPASTPTAVAPEAKRQTEIKPEKTTEEVKEKPQPKASEKDVTKYKIKVGSLIATQARRLGSIGNGYAAVSFRINENGEVGSISIKSSSSPKHADAAKRIISGVHAGPPPGGSISLNQRFQFN